MAYQQSYTLSPGPCSLIALSLQHQHRFTAIQEGHNPTVLKARAHYHMHGWLLHNRMRPYIVNVGLHGVFLLGTVKINHALVTALLELWRQDTHTLHLPIGEATITFQDVAVLLGLPMIAELSLATRDMTGGPVISYYIYHLMPIHWMGQIKITMTPRAICRMISIQCHRRCHATVCPGVYSEPIGSLLFPYKSRSDVRLLLLPLHRDLEEIGNFSWSTSVLTCLYRQLCCTTQSTSDQIVGLLILRNVRGVKD